MSDADDLSAPTPSELSAEVPVGTADAAGSDARPEHVRRRTSDWRWWVGGLGKTLITVGLLMFGFVAYQLWGTGIEAARAQNALESEFEELLEVTPAPSTTVAPPTSAPEEPSATVPEPAAAPVQDLPPFEEGDPIARIEIPSIGVDKIVVAGVSVADLKKGPGHYPDTPLPGQLGNASVAAHRTTYGQPFYDIDKVQPGDEIIMTTPAGRFVYRATGTQVVTPSDYWVVATTDPTRATLTLTSCDPKFTAQNRIVVSADFDAAASSAPAGRAVLDYGRVDPDADPDTDGAAPATSVAPTPSTAVPGDSVPDDSTPADPPGSDPMTTDPVPADVSPVADQDEIADAFSEGWFSDPGAWPQVVLWGLALVAIAVASSALGRVVGRRWVGWLAAVIPFVFCLYFFYQNVNRLLPPNL